MSNKVKIAVKQNTEELDQFKTMVLNRAATRAQAEDLFSAGASRASRDNRGQIDKLFIQAPANQTMHPSLVKTAAPRVSALFEKLSGLDEAQKRFPELQKVARAAQQPLRPAHSLKPRASADPTATTGATPVQSSLSGGSA